MPQDQIQLLEQLSLPILLAVLWTLPWKAVALWKAAKNNHKAWFVILLVVNTLAILEIIYIFIFSKRKKKQEDIINSTLNI